MKLVKFQSLLLAIVSKESLKQRNKFTHSLVQLARRWSKKPTFYFESYTRILEYFASGAETLDTYWEYEIAILELWSAGKACNLLKSGYDSLLSIADLSVDEIVAMETAMEIEEDVVESLQMISEGDLLLLLAKRINLAREKELLQTDMPNANL